MKIIFNLKMSCENPLRILFTPYPIHSDLGAILPLFDFDGSSDCRPISKSLGSRGWVKSLVTDELCLSANSKALREGVWWFVKIFLCFSPRS